MFTGWVRPTLIGFLALDLKLHKSSHLEKITKCEDLCSFKSKAKSYFFIHEFIIPFYIYYSSYIIVHTFIHRYLFTCKLLQKSPLGALINYYYYWNMVTLALQ